MKKLIIKISITLALILSAIAITIFLSKSETAKEKGTFEFTLIDKNNNTIYYDNISFFEGDTLLEVLDEKYGVTYENGQFGAILLGVGSIQTDFYHTSYLSIYIDDVYSSKGISSIELTNGLRIKLVEVIL